MKLFSAHQLLLMRRERKAVMGYRATGIWLLSAVLIATFLSIAFSEGSMAYLDEKMKDPFTLWLNASRTNGDTNVKNIADSLLTDDELKQRFLYDGTQTTHSSSLCMLSKRGDIKLFSIQYYEDITSDLIREVLKGDNVVRGTDQPLAIDYDSIDSESLGIIMTEGVMNTLGYTVSTIPAFVNMRTVGVDTLGFPTYGRDGKAYAAPVPLLAVVKRLPMRKEMLVPKNVEVFSNAEAFQMNQEAYAHDLYYYVPEEVEERFDVVVKDISDKIPDSLLNKDMPQLKAKEKLQCNLRSWRKGSIRQLFLLERPNLSTVNDINQDILNVLSESDIERVYDYTPKPGRGSSNHVNDSYNGLSIHFNQLDSIRSFERYATQRWKGLEIEMSQVNAKENFNSVSTMANILTVALIVFSIIAIVIFIVNMMQNYFQKVKRNLGTFKAFGISTKELIMVYMTIVLGIIVLALLIALTVTWGAELLLNLCGCTKEGGAPHLILWNYRTLFAIVIILSSTVISTLIVMRRLLRQTPGDLIYDRGA